MSFQAMAWAVQQELPALQKLTLLLLANYAGNESGECWPSIGTIAKQAGMSRDSVMRAIREMETAGLLSVVRRTVEGVNLPNIYRLNLSAPVRGVVADSDHAAVAHSGEGGRSQRGGVVADSDSNLSSKPIKDTTTTRTRAKSQPLPLSPTVIELPLSDGTAHAVTEADVQLWARIYPAVDIRAQLLRMLEWCRANPRRLKTPRGIGEFVKSWLSDKQDNPQGHRNAPAQQHHHARRLSASEEIDAARIAAGVDQRFDLIG